MLSRRREAGSPAAFPLRTQRRRSIVCSIRRQGRRRCGRTKRVRCAGMGSPRFTSRCRSPHTATRVCMSSWRWWMPSAVAARRSGISPCTSCVRASVRSARRQRSFRLRRPSVRMRPFPGPPHSQDEATMAKKPSAYTAEDIEILEDLSPILHRPGMCTDPVNPNHALVEVIDNAADEGLAGFATNVSVILYEGGSAAVEDNGRGIPVDIHPKKKIPAVQVIFTTLHSGGKFRKTDKDAAYRIAGGLHGVGVCVPNALSKRLEVDVKRDGAAWRIVFGNNGKVL